MSSIVSLNPRSCEEIASLSLFLYQETRTVEVLRDTDVTRETEKNSFSQCGTETRAPKNFPRMNQMVLPPTQ
eukprot:scaffold77843_cov52-Attheya_sp.AAC.3